MVLDDPDQDVGGLLGVDVPGVDEVPQAELGVEDRPDPRAGCCVGLPVRGEPDPTVDDLGTQRRDDPGEFRAPLVRGGENAPQQAAVGGWPGHCPLRHGPREPGRAPVRLRLAGVRAILAEAVGEQGQQQRADVVEVPVDELAGDAGLHRDVRDGQSLEPAGVDDGHRRREQLPPPVVRAQVGASHATPS